ncbi:transposase [Brucella intermedia]|uniref:transposase n=1 Tax=Brucella intermedia TaxID=94625 RepID=UPI00224B5D33|nr:transposase [Brucella intermedia]
MDTPGVEQIEAVADQGYFKIEDIEACVAAGITAYMPKPLRGPAVAQGFFPKEEFRYNQNKDIFLCPGDQVLSPRYYGKSRDNVKIDCVNCVACKACHLRERCTKSFRRVSRLENEAVLGRKVSRLAARPDILDRRRESVEHPFDTIKQWMNQGAFLMRRLENVRGEFSLTALTYNIKRAITLAGVQGLIAAARA